MTLNEFLTQYDINESIIFDERVHRFKFSGSKSKSGWYIGFTVGNHQTVVAGDFRLDEKWIWNSSGNTALDPEMQKRLSKAQHEANELKKKKQTKTAIDAARIVETMTPVDVKQNIYLVKKEITNADGCGMHNGNLIIPMYTPAGSVSSIQTIYKDGSKRFMSGGKIEGSSFTIKGSVETIYITEGYATGASINQATGCTVFCAFMASNLERVYQTADFMYPDAKIILAADNDEFTMIKGKKVNTGLNYAEKLSVKYDLEYVLPSFKNIQTEPTDYNDLMVLEGLDTVKNQLAIQVNIIGDDVIEALTAPKKPGLLRLWKEIGVATTRQGQPIINEFNVFKVLAFDDKIKRDLYYDTFHRKIFFNGKAVEDFDVLEILTDLQGQYGLTKLSLSMVRNAVEQHAHKNSRNECFDYMDGLKWDGYGRVTDFFNTYCETPDSEYTSAISKNWWISMVARILKPGVKVDNMVILEGCQGKLKSSLLEVIAGKWYAENTAEIGDKDFYQNLEGVLIMEIAELDSFSKAGVTTIKRTLSSRIDKYRPSYGRYSMSFPRQCVFVGTTNEREYLKDDTGGRRFWPIKCVKIDIEAVKRDRDQLFAEAVHMYKKGKRWYEVPKIAAEIQENRRDVDPWEDKILQFAHEITGRLTTGAIMLELKIDISKQTKRESNRIGKILRAHDYKSKTYTMTGQTNKIRYWIKETI